MLVSCTSLCMGRHSLAKVFEALLEMEFTRYELAVFQGSSHIRPSEVLEDPAKVASRMKAAHGLTCGAIYYCEKPSDPQKEKAYIRGLACLARLTHVPVVTVLGNSKETDWDQEVERLGDLVSLGASEGVQICLATHGGTWADKPADAIKLCAEVRGLALTLDPSHLCEFDLASKEMEEMLSKVVHTHLRDSTKGPRPVQVKVGSGVIEHAKLINILEKQGYNRLLSIDLHEIPDCGFPVLPEVRKLKYLLESSF